MVCIGIYVLALLLVVTCWGGVLRCFRLCLVVLVFRF